MSTKMTDGVTLELDVLLHYLPQVDILTLALKRNYFICNSTTIRSLLSDLSYYLELLTRSYDVILTGAAVVGRGQQEEIVKQLTDTMLQVVINLDTFKRHYEETLDEFQPATSCFISATTELSDKPGSAKVSVDFDQVLNLRTIVFSWKKIADLLDVSESWLRKKRVVINTDELCQYSDIPNDSLDRLVSEILEQSPNSDEKMVIGALLSCSIRVQRERIRLSLDRVNPSQKFLNRKIERRVYNVAAPNHLWHMEGNHKLIRWRFVVHGCVDGFSRLIVFLKCATNNRAETVLEHFLLAIQRFRCPLRIRTDCGTENAAIARWMLEHHGVDKKPFLTGLSVHNQRIERLWVDVKIYVLQHFINLFCYLESCEMLDPDNELHLFALHFVYQPRISNMLDKLLESWNNHGIRTENNRSPLQVWVEGFYGNCSHADDYLMASTSIHADHFYGVDDDGPNAEVQTCNDVQVPAIDLQLTDEQLDSLLRNSNPLLNDNSFGVTIYLAVVTHLDSMY